MNRLANEKSLYLKQHAENPVDWYPWGEEALTAAREQDKPILVSIGYSACHWCHVMAHESFEDDYIARLMNKHFICIKIDREERPDLDQIYMEAVQMMNGQGGWPLNVFCLPDGRPFAGGTYFPPKDTGRGIIPWPQLIMRVADFYKRNREDVEENATSIIGNLAVMNKAPEREDGEAALTPPDLLEAARQVCEQHDDGYGGFGEAPKFAPSMTLDFLTGIRCARAVDEGNPELASKIDSVVNTTLIAMSRGGIFDQIGGGFARYSVDRYWLIPHFEKMLYDNGLILDAYVKGWQSYRKPIYRNIIEETISWLMREMKVPGAGFCSSLDADSEGEEGKFYVWTPQQVADVLGQADAERFCQAYGITETGNFEHGTSNPALMLSHPEAREALKPMRGKLLAARNQRVHPGKDTKQLVAWNALAIRGMAEAGFWLGNREWLEVAREAADWIWDTLRSEDDRLFSVCYEGQPRQNAFLDDYAFLAEAMLSLAGKVDWLSSGSSATYLDRAKRLADVVLKHFSDPSGEAGFFFTSDDHENIPARRKEWFDNALPCGNSSMVQVLVGLYAITGDERYNTELGKFRQAYAGLARRAPRAAAHALSAFTQDALGVAVVKVKNASVDDLREAIAARPWRRITILQGDAAQQPEGYQLCIGTQCMDATRDVAQLAEML